MPSFFIPADKYNRILDLLREFDDPLQAGMVCLYAYVKLAEQHSGHTDRLMIAEGAAAAIESMQSWEETGEVKIQ